MGATYKGFNDTLASWGSGRIMGQQCGQTWIQTFSEINRLYDSEKQLPSLQLVTWNDYEEGTEIESGIENCLALSASVKGNALQWTTGESAGRTEDTIDHYTAYISSDGKNLMPLADLVSGVHSLNLCSFPIPAGSYSLFVQAVGKPDIVNQITGAVTYAPACGGQAPGTLSFSAAPDSVTVLWGHSPNLKVTAKLRSGSFNPAISLSCSGLPEALSCSFSPASITPARHCGEFDAHHLSDLSDVRDEVLPPTLPEEVGSDLCRLAAAVRNCWVHLRRQAVGKTPDAGCSLVRPDRVQHHDHFLRGIAPQCSKYPKRVRGAGHLRRHHSRRFRRRAIFHCC